MSYLDATLLSELKKTNEDSIKKIDLILKQINTMQIFDTLFECGNLHRQIRDQLNEITLDPDSEPDAVERGEASGKIEIL